MFTKGQITTRIPQVLDISSNFTYDKLTVVSSIKFIRYYYLGSLLLNTV